MVRRKKSVAFGVGVGLVAAASIAVAAWLVTGSGFGRAGAGQLENVTIIPDDAATIGELFPNGDGGLALIVENSNDADLFVDSIGAGPGEFARQAADPPGSGAPAPECALSLNQAALDAAVVGDELPANSSTSFTVQDAVHMGGGADNSCQGDSFDISLQLTASTG